MSYQTQQVVGALPASLPELVERTGYPVAGVLRFIIAARSEGHRINAIRGPGGSTVFELAKSSPVVGRLNDE